MPVTGYQREVDAVGTRDKWGVIGYITRKIIAQGVQAVLCRQPKMMRSDLRLWLRLGEQFEGQ